MVVRLALGHLGGGQYGLKVSKPGVDVFAAADDQLFLSTGFKSFQFAHAGVIADPGSVGAERTVSFPAIGIKPRIWVASSGWSLEVKNGTLTSTGFTVKTTFDQRTTFGSAPNLNGDIYWAVMNEEYEF
ncbi:hypothetical protein [Maritalea myrionectae]|uniref:hypothetical protein n=1 Tax=Maritalea myrionectae TaxID=454601 RepID=UPI000417872C|nr:hypothetical protein [Maritalea myrionectae]